MRPKGGVAVVGGVNGGEIGVGEEEEDDGLGEGFALDGVGRQRFVEDGGAGAVGEGGFIGVRDGTGGGDVQGWGCEGGGCHQEEEDGEKGLREREHNGWRFKGERQKSDQICTRGYNFCLVSNGFHWN